MYTCSPLSINNHTSNLATTSVEKSDNVDITIKAPPFSGDLVVAFGSESI
jgi:hypothetical protein